MMETELTRKKLVGFRLRQPTPEQKERTKLFDSNQTKLRLFLRDQPMSDQWTENPLEALGGGKGPILVNRYFDPVVEAFSTYVGGRLDRKSALLRPDFNPALEFEKFLELYKGNFGLSRPISPANSVDSLEIAAMAFVRELYNANPQLSEAGALAETKRVLRPLVLSLFAKPSKPKKRAGTPPTLVLAILTLWQERLAARLNCSIEDLPQSEDGGRITMAEWTEIVRTKVPNASQSLVRQIRAEVYELRRSRRRVPTTRRGKIKKRKN